MFGHIFKYRFKSLLRRKEEVFWNAVFPILLCLCFFLAFSNISKKSWEFSSIPVAVVYEKNNDQFKAVLENVAKNDSQGQEFLKVTETDYEKAEEMLVAGDVDVILKVSDTINLVVKKSGLNQTAVKSFVQQYNLKENMVKDILETNPSKLPELAGEIMNSVDTIKNKSLTAAEVDPFSTYYFSLIGMTLLFGGFFGMQCAKEMKANASSVGMRKCVSPSKRGKLIMADFFAGYLLHLITVVILLLFMRFVLKINLGNQLGYIALVCAVGSLFGMSVGMFIGSFAKLKEGAQAAIFIIFSLGSSFFAGLMVPDIKSWVVHNVPVLAKFNPATLIEDSFYSLLVYDTHEKYFTNIAILGGMTLVFCVLSYLMTRRKSYASL